MIHESATWCITIGKPLIWTLRCWLFRPSTSPHFICLKNKITREKFGVIYEWRGVEGIWTPDEDFADPCLTTWPRRHLYNEDCDWTYSNSQPSMFERAMGFEPTTFSLARRRTTTVLRPQIRSCYRTGVPRPRIGLGTPRFSVVCSTNWAISAKVFFLLSVRDFTLTYIDCQEKPVSS